MATDDKLNPFDSGDRDQVIKTMIRHDNSHLGKDTMDVQDPKFVEHFNDQYYIRHPEHRKTYAYWSELNPRKSVGKRIALVTPPSWGVMFPPYSTARLTGLLRHYGYGVDVFDTNIECYHHVNANKGKDWWNSIYFFSWDDPQYTTDVHPTIVSVLDDHVDKIVNSNVDVIGFSIYQSSIMASMYMIEQVVKRKPDARIAVGGPEVFNSWFLTKLSDEFNFDISQIDFVIQGEGEQELLTLLENLHDFPRRDDPYVMGGFKSRLDLDSLPFPDYDDFDLSLYEHPDGASIETSRGCVAKCSFCAETHFWKFRYQKANRVIEEMKYQISKYGIRRFWFVDSLANGAFTEFKNLVHAIIDEGLDIRWNSYARNDGRMDLDLFKKIHQSGCTVLSFGVESGSQKVLDDMQKKVKIWEIENNLRDGRIAGMTNHCNWIVGFPTEGKEEFLHSLELLYNVRKDMYAISPGYTCGDAPFSDMQLQWRKYKITWKEGPGDMNFLGKWYTDDYENTMVHRYIRLKLTNIWLNYCITQADGTVINTQYRPSLENSYNIKWNTPGKFVERIEQEKHNFDYWTGDSVQEKFSADLANEYLPYIWLMWKTMGGFEFEVDINPDFDFEEFGTFVTAPYYGNCKATVANNGESTITITHYFEHRTLTDDNDIANIEVKREDMSFPSKTYTFTGNINQFNSVNINLEQL